MIIRCNLSKIIYLAMAFAFIEVDKPFYFAGDTIQGRIHMNLITNLSANEVIIKFKGWESVRWVQQRIISEQERPTIQSHMIWQQAFFFRMDSSDSEDHPGEDQSAQFKYVMENGFLKQITRFSGQRQIARFDSILHNFGGSFIPAGQYTFPFSFKTGQNYPASYIDRSPVNKRRGRIKYELQAFVRGFNSHLLFVRSKQEIVIRQTGVIKNDQQQMQAHVTSCCCIDQGTTRIQVHFEKNGYTPGEQAKMFCKVDATQSKTDVVSVNVSLINDITYTSSENIKKTFRESIFHKTFPGLKMGEKGQRQQTAIIENQKGGNPMDIKPTARGTRLHSIYYLLVEASLAAFCTCCSNLPVVKQPILIYPHIPVDYNFKPQVSWHPEIFPMINLEVGMSLPKINMKVDMGGMNVQMNVPTVAIVSQPAVSMNVSSPNITMKVNSPTIGIGMSTGVGMSGGVSMSTGVGMGGGGVSMSTGIGMGGGGVSMSTGVGMGGGGVSMSTGIGMGGGVSVNSHHHHNTNVKMGVGVSGGHMGVSGGVKIGGGMGMGLGLGMNAKFG